MQGAGNDFVVLDNRQLQYTEKEIAELAPEICDRKFGVGSDGILALAKPQQQNVDYTMIYRNPDGSNAGMCGNGARCIALFAHSLGFHDNHSFNVHNQVYQAEIVSQNAVSIAFPIQASAAEKTLHDTKLYQIYTGTEHIVIQVDADTLKDEDQLRNRGRTLRYHEEFKPGGTNVNFISGIDRQTVSLQTYERGVENLTLACGTGAIASALIWHHLQDNPAKSPFSVKTKGGTLNVYFTFDFNTHSYSNIKLEGPAHFVFKGEFLR